MGHSRSVRSRLRVVGAFLCAMALLATACGDDGSSTTTPGTTPGASGTTAAGGGVLTGAARCKANTDAGTITFLTGFGFFPSASVLDVITAQEKGYFKEMCLKVDIQPSLPGESMVLVSANNVQFAANSFGSIARGVDQGADVAAVLNYGWVAIQSLMVVKDSPIQKLADFKGKTIASTAGDVGVPIAAMLATAGLRKGVDYKEQATGFDPFVIKQSGIDGKAGYTSNDPDTLKRGGVETRLFKPQDFGATATFAAIIGSNKFIKKHPTAAEDFVRAVLKGWEYAIDPTHTAEVIGFSKNLTKGDFNLEHETYRWETERDMAVSSLPAGLPYGKIEPKILAQEMAFVVQAKLLSKIPEMETLYTNALVDAVYDPNKKVIWPGPIKG